MKSLPWIIIGTLLFQSAFTSAWRIMRSQCVHAEPSTRLPPCNPGTMWRGKNVINQPLNGTQWKQNLHVPECGFVCVHLVQIKYSMKPSTPLKHNLMCTKTIYTITIRFFFLRNTFSLFKAQGEQVCVWNISLLFFVNIRHLFISRSRQRPPPAGTLCGGTTWVICSYI